MILYRIKENIGMKVLIQSHLRIQLTVIYYHLFLLNDITVIDLVTNLTYSMFAWSSTLQLDPSTTIMNDLKDMIITI